MVFSYDLKVEPQAFADPAHYVFGQFHKGSKDAGDASCEHAIFAFREDQGGIPVFTVCGSDQKLWSTFPRA